MSDVNDSAAIPRRPKIMIVKLFIAIRGLHTLVTRLPDKLETYEKVATVRAGKAT